MLGGLERPPRESAAAQVRLTCIYASGPADHPFQTVAENIRAYRTGDPARDVELFWWPSAAEWPEIFRLMLEVSGPQGTRTALVEEAAKAGLIDSDQGSRLLGDTERPAWADGRVPWVVAEVRAAGEVDLPTGKLSGGDPTWDGQEPPWTLQIEPGRYPVRVVVAEHPLASKENVAAELRTADGEPTEWRLIETTTREGNGYVAEIGIGCFGPSESFDAAILLMPEDYPGTPCSALEFAAEPEGSFVAFSVGPQHQLCRSWIGLDSVGQICRVVTALGLIDINPTAGPLPW